MSLEEGLSRRDLELALSSLQQRENSHQWMEQSFLYEGATDMGTYTIIFRIPSRCVHSSLAASIDGGSVLAQYVQELCRCPANWHHHHPWSKTRLKMDSVQPLEKDSVAIHHIQLSCLCLIYYQILGGYQPAEDQTIQKPGSGGIRL